MSKDPPYVYVAGPYSGDQARNVSEAIGASFMVAACGGIPFLPHLYHFMSIYATREYSWWMDLCLSWLAKCDVYLELGDSPGTYVERKYADERGLKIFTGLDATSEFRHWMEERG